MFLSTVDLSSCEICQRVNLELGTTQILFGLFGRPDGNTFLNASWTHFKFSHPNLVEITQSYVHLLSRPLDQICTKGVHRPWKPKLSPCFRLETGISAISHTPLLTAGLHGEVDFCRGREFCLLWFNYDLVIYSGMWKQIWMRQLSGPAVECLAPNLLSSHLSRALLAWQLTS